MVGKLRIDDHVYLGTNDHSQHWGINDHINRWTNAQP